MNHEMTIKSRVSSRWPPHEDRTSCAEDRVAQTARRGRRPHRVEKDCVGTQEVPLGPVGLSDRGGLTRADQSQASSRNGMADRDVVPLIPPKETRREEGRSRPEETPNKEGGSRTQGRDYLPPNLARVNEAARKSRRSRFTALMHHVDLDALTRAFGRQKRSAAPGVDGETVETYELQLEENLRELLRRLHNGGYRPSPVRRAYIPKSDGGKRPLGVTTLEDKIVQSAVAEVLSAIYEADFLGFSYGFRPGKSPHHALSALQIAIITRRVNWILDADISKFFDSVNHEWLMQMLRHRIADRRILSLIEGWLRAGVLESGMWSETVEGTPQGSGISPLLANVFLHYVLDLWANQWRTKTEGMVSIIRYCDDFVIGFERQSDAMLMHKDLEERLGKFGLMFHKEKTRLIPFGRFAKRPMKADGSRSRLPTFNFLGFTHYCAMSQQGKFVVKRKTQGKRMIRKLKDIREEMRLRMHEPMEDQHRWLAAVLRGHYRYYGLPANSYCLASFTYQVKLSWFKTLRRRGGRIEMSWKRFDEYLKTFQLPRPADHRPRQIIIRA